MSQIYRLFFKGFFTLLPIALTLYILYWFFSSIEGLLNRHIVSIIPDHLHFPGMGIATAFAVFLAVGFLMQHFAGGRLSHFFEDQFRKVPVIGTVYGPLKDLTGLFASGPGKKMKRVVLINMPAYSGKMLGLVTRDHFDDLPETGIQNDSIAVYIPGTFFFGGFTMIFPKAQLEELDLPPERALKIAITGWIKGDLKTDMTKFRTDIPAQDHSTVQEAQTGEPDSPMG